MLPSVKYSGSTKIGAFTAVLWPKLFTAYLAQKLDLAKYIKYVDCKDGDSLKDLDP